MNYLYFVDAGGQWVSSDIVRRKLHDVMLVGGYSVMCDQLFTIICDYMLGYLDDALFDNILAERFKRVKGDRITSEWPTLSAAYGKYSHNDVLIVAQMVRGVLHEYQLCEIE